MPTKRRAPEYFCLLLPSLTTCVICSLYADLEQHSPSHTHVNIVKQKRRDDVCAVRWLQLSLHATVD